MEQTATAVEKGTIHARIIRADGSVEDLGMIASTSRLDRIKIALKKLLR